MIIVGQLGRGMIGGFELGKPRDRSSLRGETILGTFACESSITNVTFEGNHGATVQLGSFECDIVESCGFVGVHKIRALFHCDFGITSVVWVSGTGAVAITCLVSGQTIMSTPFATFLFDAPYSY